jgi:benzoyl-CoA reductase/2-hydroxyglutaryl-CoA dehydratase subunit BcrC/BadD/HgdB
VKEVLYASPFVPREWIAAHGLRPRLVVAKPLGNGAPQPRTVMGACHFAETLLQMAASAEAAVFVTSCDQMRRAADQASSLDRVFLMNVPATWQAPAARQLYRAEIERLGAFLVRLGGATPSPDALAAEMRRHVRARGVSCENRATAEACSKVPLALVGESLLPAHLDLPRLIGARGGRVALDATSDGERGQPVFPDEARIDEAPFAAMVDGYFDGVTDVFQRPNTRLYDWLRPRLAERGIRGIVLWHYSWCDLWRAEASRLREEFRLPMLHLDAGDSLTPSMKTRVEAFLEILHA